MSGINSTSLVTTGNPIQKLDSKSSNPESSFSAATEGNQEAYEDKSAKTRLSRDTARVGKRSSLVLMSENGQAEKARQYKSYFVDGRVVEAAELTVA